MAQSLAKIYIHLIFSTKERERTLLDEIRPELHAYMGGTLKGLGCSPIEINTEPDHLHALFLLARTAALSDVLAHTGAWPVSTEGQALAALWNHLRQQAQMVAYQDTFLMLCGMTLLAVVPALVVHDRRRKP